jgi:hypothetical protein
VHWLLFIPNIPTKPDYLRVKLRRRLMGLGALPLRDALYALPHQGDCLEDLAWLRQDLIKDGGDAVICTAALISGATDESLTDAFNKDRSAMYAEITRLANETARDAARPSLKRLRRMLRNVVEIDYFQVEARVEAETAIRELEMRMNVPEQPVRTAIVERGRTWVTRAGVKVDRISSAWLIRRFIDPEAQIRFVDPSTYQHQSGELRFDMFDGEYTHRGDYCTFETLVAHFALHDAALRALAEIVHDIDVKDAKFERAETAGVAAFIDGLVRSEAADEARLQRGFVVFDSLYQSLSPRP